MTGADDVDSIRKFQAAEWCLRVSEGLGSLEEQAEFEAWLAADPSNRATFDAIAKLWSDTVEVADAPVLIGVRADALEVLRARTKRRWGINFHVRSNAVKAIAACLLVAFVTTLWFTQPRTQVFETARGERRVAVLEDGSKVSLDAATRVEVAYSDQARALRLVAGRAKFNVAKDPRRPFTVTAGGRVVVATGTEFSVELVHREMRVILYEGNVAVLEEGPTNKPPRHLLAEARRVSADQLLKPGTGLVASLARPVATLEAVDPVRSLSWEGGQLNFADEPLSLAAERVNRYSNLRIDVEGPVSDILVSGTFNAGDAEGFIDGLGELYALDVRRDGNHIVVRKGREQ